MQTQGKTENNFKEMKSIYGLDDQLKQNHTKQMSSSLTSNSMRKDMRNKKAASLRSEAGKSVSNFFEYSPPV